MRPKDVVLAWAKALNARDITALVALYASDAIGHHPAGPRVEGQTAIIQMFQDEIVRSPDVGLEIINVFEDGEWAILEWKRLSKLCERLAGCSPSDKNYHELQGCTFFRVHEGRIAFQWGYWNRIGLP